MLDKITSSEDFTVRVPDGGFGGESTVKERLRYMMREDRKKVMMEALGLPDREIWRDDGCR